MNTRTFLALLVSGSVLLAPAAQADPNSKWGEGWTNMPNDVHNTRIDTLDGDNSAFTGFVRYGNGADPVNRFRIASDTTAVSSETRDAFETRGTQDRMQTRSGDQTGERKQHRYRNQTRSMGRSMSSGRSSMGQGGGRR
ncbi:MAG TPA: hypothetical protein EYP40_06630 [Chromatiales bacterium]|nr:hypothetical protein [Chromatiales bacterium]